MVIAICGASGSGKTTLAKWLAKNLEIGFFEQSAGLIIPEATQNYLQDEYGWKKAGHKEVIQLSNANPQFGLEFQIEILRARTGILKKLSEIKEHNCIIDRSPVDNLSYFLLQCSHNQNEEDCQRFIGACQDAMQYIDKIIFVQTGIPIIDNGSRVPNIVYQQLVDNTFSFVIKEYFTVMFNVQGLTITGTDLAKRCELASKFIKE